MPTPSATLRAAAQKIRDTADRATPGPWIDLDNGDRIVRDPEVTAAESDDDPCGAGAPLEYVVDEPLYANPANGAHIVLWDPVVAEAVAVWLDEEADSAEEPSIYGAAGQAFVHDYPGSPSPALTLARLILGEVTA